MSRQACSAWFNGDADFIAEYQNRRADAPFKSNQDYNMLFAEHSGERPASQTSTEKGTGTHVRR